MNPSSSTNPDFTNQPDPAAHEWTPGEHALAQPTAGAPAHVELEILSGSRRDDILRLPIPGSYTLGTSEDCALRFDPAHEPFVSRHHARLTLTTEHATLTDTDSRNGTFLDGHEVAESEHIHCGDILELGIDGPRLRFDAKDNHYLRPHLGRSTVLIRRAAPTPPPTPARKRPWRTAFAALLALLVLVVLQQSGLFEAAPATSTPEPPSTRLPAEQYKGAVFLIAMRVTADSLRNEGQTYPHGHLLPLGTAWAFDAKGLLATNGHMLAAAEEIRRALHPQAELVLVQNETGRLFRPRRTRMHPRWKKEDMREIIHDVAILAIDEPLPVVFPVASTAQSHALSSGETVYSLGFPIERVGMMENLYGYERPEQVVATLRQGVVQRLTNVDGQAADPGARRMVHLGLTTSGGQSGSPVFARDGTVVAILSATAVARIGSSSMPHPGLYTYSVRVDALEDLIRELREDPSLLVDLPEVDAAHPAESIVPLLPPDFRMLEDIVPPPGSPHAHTPGTKTDEDTRASIVPPLVPPEATDADGGTR